jgi:hypothetical protein
MISYLYMLQNPFLPDEGLFHIPEAVLEFAAAMDRSCEAV